MTDTKIKFAPIKNKRVFEKLTEHIKNLIIQGDLKTGDRLPSEHDLAEQFQVGRQTVREALRILELSGFITVRTGAKGGATVSNTTFNTMNDLFLDVFQIEKISMEEITAVRWDVEKAILGHVIEKADATDIDNLSMNIGEAKIRAGQGLPFRELNFAFHKLLGKATKNRVHQIVVELIMSVLLHFQGEAPPDLAFSIKSLKHHEKLLDTIIAKDLDKALQILEKHLLEDRDRFKCCAEPAQVQNS
ncbi:MAG: FadR/GntR family transcriptional regulator [Desulfatiglandales bacterium]